MGNKTRLIVLFIALAILLLFGFLVYPKLNAPKTLKPGDYSTQLVEKGNVISSIKATGVVEAENEVLILSPTRSIVKKIHREPGSWVDQGELIIQLDKENVRSEIERISDQLEMKRNSLEKTQLNAQSTRLDLGYNEEVKKLRITSLKSTLADQEQLLEVGGISPARIEKTKQEIVLAEKDLETLKEKNAIRLKQLATDEKGLVLQIKAQEKTLAEKKELLGKLDIKAPSAGIILAVTGNEGERVEFEKTLVRMSDLTSFKVSGSINEKFAKQIKTGNRVMVTIDNENLPGRIGNITPLVENEKVQFNVHLKDKSHPKLIANQNVEVFIVNSNKQEVLRLKRLPEFKEEKRQKFFVLQDNEAVKTEVVFGTFGDEYIEVISGLKEGDKIIIEGINSFRGVDRIEIE